VYNIPQYQIRAVYDEHVVRVYQAFCDEIADAALTNGTFISPPFSMNRMTWIKPSFLWMMYRAGWGYKEPAQRRILAIDIRREGFEWALTHSCPSHRDPTMTKDDWIQLKEKSPVRIQWDPERSLTLEALPYRAIQIGLGKIAVLRYVNEWIQKITDITPIAHEVHRLVQENMLEKARRLLPLEKVLDERDKVPEGYP
jgi:hypothetical protein